MRTLPRILGLVIPLSLVCPLLDSPHGPALAGGQPPVERAQDATHQRPARDQSRRRLRDELESTRARLDAAIRLLDEGGDPARIREELDKAAPWRAGGRSTRAQRAEPQGEDAPRVNDRAPRPLPGDARFEISPTERADILRFLDENAPRVGARLRELDLTTPDLVTRLLTRMRPRIREVMETGTTDPELRDLRLNEFRASLDVMWARRALDEAKNAGREAEINGRREELRTAIGNHFDAQAALQEHEADRLMQRVERLRKDLSERKRDRDSIVEREMQGRWSRGGDHPSSKPRRDDPSNDSPDEPR